jgi:hypothetical protein
MINPTTHAITEYSSGLASGSVPDGIVAGPDGNVWFTDVGSTPAIGMINPTTHAITEYSSGLNPGSKPIALAAGQDGNLWFTDGGTTPAIGVINPTTHAITEYSSGLSSGSEPFSVAAGADGNLWFGDDGTTSAIGVINPATHAISEIPSAFVGWIVPGPDGNLWFTGASAIGVIDPTTRTVTDFSSGLNSGSVPAFITTGPDGNMWFTDRGSTKAIGRITTPPAAMTSTAHATGATSGAISGVANGHAQATSFHIEYGPVGGATTSTGEQSLGTTSSNTSISASLTGLRPGTAYRARVVVTNPTGTGVGTFLTFRTPTLALTNVRQSHRRWRESTALPHIANARPPVGTMFGFTLNESARVRLAFTQRLAGRAVGGRCVAPTSGNGQKPACTRIVTRGALSFSIGSGAHRVRFQGRLSKHKRLKPGRYTLVLTASSAGERATARLAFTIVGG